MNRMPASGSRDPTKGAAKPDTGSRIVQVRPLAESRPCLVQARVPGRSIWAGCSPGVFPIIRIHNRGAGGCNYRQPTTPGRFLLVVPAQSVGCRRVVGRCGYRLSRAKSSLLPAAVVRPGQLPRRCPTPRATVGNRDHLCPQAPLALKPDQRDLHNQNKPFPGCFRTLAAGTITNLGTGSPTHGNYFADLRDKAGRPWRHSSIANFPCKRLLAWDLLYRVSPQSSATATKSDSPKTSQLHFTGVLIETCHVDLQQGEKVQHAESD